MDEIENIAKIVLAIVALLTLIKAVFEYVLQGRLKRAQLLYDLREKLKGNNEFNTITDLLDAKEESEKRKLRDVTYTDRRNFASLLEHIGIMVNSKLINKDVAYTFYNYTLTQCWESHHFWHDLKKDTGSWDTLKKFHEDMKSHQSTLLLKYKCNYFRLKV
jgi:hypothetical protein